LLVGNFSFGESEINAFDPLTGLFEGSIAIDTGSAGAGGLWDIGFGVGGGNGDPNTLYFTDGINGERKRIVRRHNGSRTPDLVAVWRRHCRNDGPAAGAESGPSDGQLNFSGALLRYPPCC